ncbi:DsbE family thiol:disulfide interchange protein [Gallibacterium melopsittaci]|uniref:DsbE family thiol:disulfide interchange protein n=1 Tax=Gallibacterium melopsittaci TaxID=516063 RepID=A0ABV6HUD7_9PAST
MKRWLLFTPVIIILLFALVLFFGLNQDPLQKMKDHLNKPLPALVLSDLQDNTRTWQNSDLPQGQVYLINIWGSWCQYCKQEFPLLHHISQQYQLPIIGIDYLDKRENALNTLAELGNPFQLNAYDSKGVFAAELGINGAPYTFIIDKKGIIRYFFEGGAINQTIWQQQMLPLIQQLRTEP